MKPYYEHGGFTVYQGDCLGRMAELEPDSIDAIVTDPPYGLSFMGKGWDHGVPGEPFWAEALRVAKPGAPLLAFGGTRTHHRLMCAIEDAGWEIRDCLMWLYGSGFPKSLDVSKALDKAAGAEREVIGVNEDYLRRKPNGMKTSGATAYQYSESQQETDARITAPATDLARRWHGYGTALKPAWEPIILAMKPTDGTFAANAEKWGVAGVNVEGCRVEHDGSGSWGEGRRSGGFVDTGASRGASEPNGAYSPAGRFPANLILDEEAGALLDEQAGVRRSGLMRAGTQRGNREGWAGPMPERTGAATYGDTGGPSRFFYCAKASSADRNEGLEGMPAVVKAQNNHGNASGDNPDPVSARWRSSMTNHHPTVKPRDLMRYLCTLVLPPERETPRVILDPFAGSGSTAIGAQLAGWDECILIERDPEYAEIARRRIAAV